MKWVLITALAWLSPGSLEAAEQHATILVKLPSGAQITTEVAETPAQRYLGLMFRDKLLPDHGMLFIFQESDYHGIWMKNCRIPLDIIWLDKNQRIVHTEENVPPCQSDPCHTYYPAQKALFVLELNAGLIEKEGIEPGLQVIF